jgi:hypothetical protein
MQEVSRIRVRPEVAMRVSKVASDSLGIQAVLAVWDGSGERVLGEV